MYKMILQLKGRYCRFSTLWLAALSIMMVLFVGCERATPVIPTKQTPEPEENKPQKFTLGRYLPPLFFGKEEGALSAWLQEHAAREEARDAYSIRYTLPSDSFPALRLLFIEGQYREAIQQVKDHGVSQDPLYRRFLEEEGFAPLSEKRWINRYNPALFIDVIESETLEDVVMYEAYNQVDFQLPYTRFQEKITRKKLREELAQSGYTYDAEASTTYKQVFRTPMKHFPLMDIYFDRNTERPRQTVLYAESKYAIRSPHLVVSLEKENFVEERFSHPLSPILSNAELGVRAHISIPSESSVEGGFISFETYEDPNAPVEISKMEFPLFDFGATWQQIAEFETARGHSVTDFMVVLNATTTDPYFVVHGYYFSSQEPKVCREVVTVVKNNTILASNAFRQLMEQEGFEFFKEENGKYTYFHKTLPIIAIANSQELPHSITYRQYP